jgi:hypothetical protein
VARKFDGVVEKEERKRTEGGEEKERRDLLVWRASDDTEGACAAVIPHTVSSF